MNYKEMTFENNIKGFRQYTKEFPALGKYKKLHKKGEIFLELTVRSYSSGALYGVAVFFKYNEKDNDFESVSDEKEELRKLFEKEIHFFANYRGVEVY